MRRLMTGAALVVMTSAAMMTSPVMNAAMADDDDAKGAQKLAIQGRDDYWHCLAREYSRDANSGLSEQEFGRSVAGACPSERQYYRVALLDFLTSQYPAIDEGARLATANRAVEAAQRDIVTAFVRRRAPAK